MHHSDMFEILPPIPHKPPRRFRVRRPVSKLIQLLFVLEVYQAHGLGARALVAVGGHQGVGAEIAVAGWVGVHFGEEGEEVVADLFEAWCEDADGGVGAGSEEDCYYALAGGVVLEAGFGVGEDGDAAAGNDGFGDGVWEVVSGISLSRRILRQDLVPACRARRVLLEPARDTRSAEDVLACSPDSFVHVEATNAAFTTVRKP